MFLALKEMPPHHGGALSIHVNMVEQYEIADDGKEVTASCPDDNASTIINLVTGDVVKYFKSDVVDFQRHLKATAEFSCSYTEGQENERLDAVFALYLRFNHPKLLSGES